MDIMQMPIKIGLVTDGMVLKTTLPNTMFGFYLPSS